MDRDAFLSYVYLLKWMLLSIIAGIVGTLTVQSFIFLSTGITSFISAVRLPLWIWPIIGAGIAGGIIYRIQPHAAGEGIPSYIRGIRIHEGNLLFSVTFFKYWAALVTIATFGNGGIVGPIGRVSAGIMAFIVPYMKKIHVGFTSHDQRTAAICGLAATIGAVFHSSIGGGIFAVEIIQRKSMGYKDLFPAILSSSTAVFVGKSLGWGGFYHFDTIDKFMDSHMIGWLLLFTILIGVCGGFYTELYSLASRRFKRKEGNVLLKVTIGSALAFIIAWTVNSELLGISKKMVPALISGNMSFMIGNLPFAQPMGLILLIMFFCKIVCNCITVGSGMSAGFTGPAVIAGMLLGAAAASFLNIAYATPTYYAFLAAGFSGMLASSMNVPLAAAVMTTEVFGLHYSLPAACAAVIGFQVMRHHTIYEYALDEFDETIKDR